MPSNFVPLRVGICSIHGMSVCTMLSKLIICTTLKSSSLSGTKRTSIWCFKVLCPLPADQLSSHSSLHFIMSISTLAASATTLDLLLADVRGEVKVTVLKPQRGPKKSAFGVRLQGNKRRTKLQATDTQYRCCLSGRRSDQYWFCSLIQPLN